MSFRSRITRSEMPIGLTLTLPKALLQRLGELKVADIINNIEQQKQGSGAPLKQNALATLKRKAARKNPEKRSLVDLRKRLLNPHTYKIKVSKTVSVTPKAFGLPELHIWLQEKGYVGWLDSSRRFMNDVRGIMRAYIQSLLKDAAKKKESQ